MNIIELRVIFYSAVFILLLSGLFFVINASKEERLDKVLKVVMVLMIILIFCVCAFAENYLS